MNKIYKALSVIPLTQADSKKLLDIIMCGVNAIKKVIQSNGIGNTCVEFLDEIIEKSACPCDIAAETRG
jgi:hypothetical protein